MHRPRTVVPFLAVLAAALPAAAQSVISTHSGLVYFFEGSVSIGDQQLEQKFGKFPDIGDGRELRTEQGRAEVLLTPGVFLRMDEKSRIRMLSTSLADTRVELLDGSAIIESREPSADNSSVVIYKDWKVRVPGRGIYRINAEPPQISVYKGDAEVTAGDHGDSTTVKEGQTLPLAAVLVSEQAPSDLNDSFDHWAMERSQAVYADNATAAQIIDDPNAIDSSGLAIGGMSYFPMTGVGSLGLLSPYGMSFWSPFQPTLNSLYMPGYAGWAYPSGGLRIYQLYPPRPYRGLYPTYGGIGARPVGGTTITRVPVTLPPIRVTPRPVGVGVRGVGGHR